MLTLPHHLTHFASSSLLKCDIILKQPLNASITPVEFIKTLFQKTLENISTKETAYFSLLFFAHNRLKAMLCNGVPYRVFIRMEINIKFIQ